MCIQRPSRAQSLKSLTARVQGPLKDPGRFYMLFHSYLSLNLKHNSDTKLEEEKMSIKIFRGGVHLLRPRLDPPLHGKQKHLLAYSNSILATTKKKIYIYIDFLL